MDPSRNVQIVRRLFRLRATGDIEETVNYYAEDAENRPLTTDRVLRGRDAIRSFLEDTAAAGTVFEPSTFRFETNEEGQVGVFGRLRVRGPEGITDVPAAWIYTLVEGKVVSVVAYKSFAEAEAAFRADENAAPTSSNR